MAALLCVLLASGLALTADALPPPLPARLHEGQVYLSYLGQRGRSGERSVTRPDLFLIRFGYASRWNESSVKAKIKAGRSLGLEGLEMEEAVRAFQKQNDLPVTGWADAVTRRAMARPRCGVSDVRRGRFAVSPDRWKSHTLTYNFVKYSSRLPRDVVELAVKRAFGYWEKVTILSFVRKPDNEPADLRIGFYSGFHEDGAYNSFDGPEGILGHAFFPRDGNIHFDETEEFTEGTKRGKNLRVVAAHEIGHALGLDHSWVPGSVMYPSYQGYVSHEDFRLTSDDVAGIRHMYGKVWSPSEVVQAAATGALQGGDANRLLALTASQSMTRGIQRRTSPRTTTTTTTTRTTTTTPTTATTTFAPITLPLWPKPTPGLGQPSPCKSKVDAAFLWHDAAKYFLRGPLLYRQGPGPSSIMSFDFPRDVRRYLVDAPLKTDAAVYSPYSTNLYLFSGRTMYIYDRFGYLREQSEVQDPNFPANMDAAFVNREGTVCLLKADTLYEFDEWRRRIDRNTLLLSVYKGLPLGIDAVINDSHWVLDYEYIYFFKDTEYYKVDIRSRSVVRSYPKAIGGPWFGCSRWTVPK